MPELPKRPVFFKEARSASVSSKPDNPGRVVVKIFHPDPNTGYAQTGQRKEEVVLEDTTVDDVYAVVRHTLLGDSA